MAAGKADQVAEAAAVQQQAAKPNSMADIPANNAVIAHTPAPDLASQSTIPTMIGADHAVGSALGQMLETGSSLPAELECSVKAINEEEANVNPSADDSPRSASGAEAGSPRREEGSAVPAVSPSISGRPLSHADSGSSSGMHLSQAGSELPSGRQPHQKEYAATGVPSTGAGNDTGRPTRSPLAAVQEGSTPMLGSLSPKPILLSRMHSEGMP